MDDVDFIKWDFIIPVVLAIVASAGFSVVVSTVMVVSSAVDNVVGDVMSAVELSTVASVLVVDVSPVNREYDLDISVQRLRKTVPTQTKVLYFHNFTFKYQACNPNGDVLRIPGSS